MTEQADLDYVKRAVTALQLEVPAAVYDDIAPCLRTLVSEVEGLRVKVNNWRHDLNLVVNGGAADQMDLDAALQRLRESL